jgi:site-specific recombinase XerD
VRNYATDLRHFFAHLDERGIDPLEISRLLFRGYLASLVDSNVARASVTRKVSTAKSFYRWLRLTGVMTDDPLAGVHGPKQQRRLPHILDVSGISDLLAAADGDDPADLRDRALLEVLYACGLRVSEAAGLDVSAVDMEQRAMVVTGKGNKQRLVVMGEPARAALERYLRRGRGPLYGTRKRNAEATGALFLNRNGGRLSQRAIQLMVRKYALAAGIDERVHPHLLRHTFATHLLDGGAELRVVQELMGHSSPNTTQIYLHVTEERQRKVVEGSLDELAAVEMARRSLSRGRGRP